MSCSPVCLCVMCFIVALVDKIIPTLPRDQHFPRRKILTLAGPRHLWARGRQGERVGVKAVRTAFFLSRYYLSIRSHQRQGSQAGQQPRLWTLMKSDF